MKKFFLLAFCTMFAIFITSCEENTTDPDAVEMNMDKLSVTPGFSWLYPKADEYGPDSIFTKNIAEKFSTDYSFVMFAKGECSCSTNRKYIAEMLKIFRVCGIPESKYEFFNMSTSKSKTPFDTILKINSLPAIFVMKNGKPVFSIMDTAGTTRYQTKDSIMLEEILLEALGK